ncbi:hypothetical protein HK101_004242 [Irineochytrium annulatum]|nr:hypothetical protein HK101_004242 [Irineochytrium annulatum]
MANTNGDIPASLIIGSLTETFVLACKSVGLLPIPVLAHCAALIHTIYSGIRMVKHQRHALDRLVDRANRILASVNVFAQRERDRMAIEAEGNGLDSDAVRAALITELEFPPHIMNHLNSLISVLQTTDEYVKKMEGKKFMQRFVNRHSIEAKISVLHQELASIAQDLSLALDVDTRRWREEDKEDRDADMQELEVTLQHLIDNDYKVNQCPPQEYMEAMEVTQLGLNGCLTILQALQKNLAAHVDKSLEKNLERLFMEKALGQLRRASQNVPPPVVQDWSITRWEVDIGDTIARGGFGEVAKGVWLGHTTVAIKRLLVRLDTNRLRDDFHREVKAWYPLRHPHVLSLLGACASAEPPFMMSRFMENGHALQYLDRHPGDVPRMVKLLYEVSQGMQYLHSRNVIHGDLKAINVLVDEHGTAYVSDFGFASLKKITSTRQTMSQGQISGTLRWMAPERLSGRPATPAIDVYAFAMTCYEVLTEGDIPLSHVPDALIYQSVVNNNSRPMRPEHEGNDGRACCSDKMWQLMNGCWHPDPLQRPSFSSVSVTVKGVLEEAEAGSRKEAAARANAAAQARMPIVGSVVDEAQSPRTPRTPKNEVVVEDVQFVSPGFAREAKKAVKRESNSDSGFGSLMSSAMESLPPDAMSLPDDPNFKLNFEEGSWGQWVSNMTSALPAGIQADLQRKMAVLGKALNNGTVKLNTQSEAIDSFAKDLQKAAAEAEIQLASSQVGSSSSSRTSSVPELHYAPRRADSMGETVGEEVNDEMEDDDSSTSSESSDSDSGQERSPDKALQREQKKYAKQLERLEQKMQKRKHKIHKAAAKKRADSDKGSKMSTTPATPTTPSSGSTPPDKSGGGILSSLFGFLAKANPSEPAPATPPVAPGMARQASMPASPSTPMGRGGLPRDHREGFGRGGAGGGAGRGGGGRGGGPGRPGRGDHRSPHRHGSSSSSSSSTSSLMNRRIPNEDARQFWTHYWGDAIFETSQSDFLSCLEEYCRLGSLPRGAITRIVNPVENKGGPMVGTFGLNALVGEHASLRDAMTELMQRKDDEKYRFEPTEADEAREAELEHMREAAEALEVGREERWGAAEAREANQQARRGAIEAKMAASAAAREAAQARVRATAAARADNAFNFNYPGRGHPFVFGGSPGAPPPPPVPLLPPTPPGPPAAVFGNGMPFGPIGGGFPSYRGDGPPQHGAWNQQRQTTTQLPAYTTTEQVVTPNDGEVVTEVATAPGRSCVPALGHRKVIAKFGLAVMSLSLRPLSPPDLKNDYPSPVSPEERPTEPLTPPSPTVDLAISGDRQRYCCLQPCSDLQNYLLKRNALVLDLWRDDAEPLAPSVKEEVLFKPSWTIVEFKYYLKRVTGLAVHEVVIMFHDHQLTDNIRITFEDLRVLKEHGGFRLKKRGQSGCGTKRLFSKGVRGLPAFLSRLEGKTPDIAGPGGIGPPPPPPAPVTGGKFGWTSSDDEDTDDELDECLNECLNELNMQMRGNEYTTAAQELASASVSDVLSAGGLHMSDLMGDMMMGDALALGCDGVGNGPAQLPLPRAAPFVGLDLSTICGSSSFERPSGMKRKADGDLYCASDLLQPFMTGGYSDGQLDAVFMQGSLESAGLESLQMRDGRVIKKRAVSPNAVEMSIIEKELVNGMFIEDDGLEAVLKHGAAGEVKGAAAVGPVKNSGAIEAVKAEVNDRKRARSPSEDHDEELADERYPKRRQSCESSNVAGPNGLSDDEIDRALEEVEREGLGAATVAETTKSTATPAIPPATVSNEARRAMMELQKFLKNAVAVTGRDIPGGAEVGAMMPACPQKEAVDICERA